MINSRGLKMFTKAQALALQNGDMFYAVSGYGGSPVIAKIEITDITNATDPLDRLITYKDYTTDPPEENKVALVRHILAHMTVLEMEGA